MAQAKTKNRPEKKAASRYYVVRRFHDVRKTVTDRMENYHRDLIKDPVESGKAFVEDFKDDPRKTMNTLVDDSRKFVADLKKDTDKRVKRFVDDGRKRYKKARKDPRKTLNSMVDDSQHFAEDLLKDGKSIMKGVENDARIVVEEMTDSGKKALDRLPGKKKFQKKMEHRIKSVPLQFNLPTRKDIDRLMDRLENLNTKLDALGQE